MPNNPMPPPPDPRLVQGIILRGYAHPCSCHMLFTLQAGPGAAGFIRALMPYVQSAQDWGDSKPDRMLNIGLTYSGILTFDPQPEGPIPERIRDRAMVVRVATIADGRRRRQ